MGYGVDPESKIFPLVLNFNCDQSEHKRVSCVRIVRSQKEIALWSVSETSHGQMTGENF